MIGKILHYASVALCAIALVVGCTNSRALSREEKDPLKFEYKSFQPVSAACLAQLKDSVAKRFGPSFAYKNTIGSREPGYREAIFSHLEGATDSSVVVKFDSACVIQRIFNSKMTIGADEYH